jgi:nitroimidazol reductase NimA-like FMN-containing flavoprotein (pyridoxamine 5'-phosphate oxidase superfamily)
MLINEMSEVQCRAVLARASVGRLGCSLDNQPYVVPIYLACDSDFIYVFSTPGKKIDWMRANPKVCVEVDEVTDQSSWVSVVANGMYQELPDPQYASERAHARKLLEKKHGWWLNALAERRLRVRDEEIEPLFFRVKIDSVSGLGAVPTPENK